MEALTAVSVAALTLYDMCKAVEKGISIGPIRLLEKSGRKKRRLGGNLIFSRRMKIRVEP